MAITVNFSPSVLSSSTLSQQLRSGPNFSLGTSADNTAISSSVSINASRLAERGALSRLSNASSSLNIREDLTSNQLQAVSSLYDLALEIKRENISSRVDSLQSEASSLISDNASSYSAALSDDSTLAEDDSVAIISATNVESGNSERFFYTNIAAVRSLDSLNINSDLSFEKDSIDYTIAELSAAKSTLEQSLAGYSSNRSALSQEISNQGQSASLSAENFNFEQLASSIAGRLSNSTADLVESHSPEPVDVEALLESEQSEE